MGAPRRALSNDDPAPRARTARAFSTVIAADEAALRTAIESVQWRRRGLLQRLSSTDR